MSKKQSGDKASSIASKVLRGVSVSSRDVKTLAGSVLSQDEKRGTRK